MPCCSDLKRRGRRNLTASSDVGPERRGNNAHRDAGHGRSHLPGHDGCRRAGNAGDGPCLAHRRVRRLRPFSPCFARRSRAGPAQRAANKTGLARPRQSQGRNSRRGREDVPGRRDQGFWRHPARDATPSPLPDHQCSCGAGGDCLPAGQLRLRDGRRRQSHPPAGRKHHDRRPHGHPPFHRREHAKRARQGRRP